jgi:DNA-binding response OmpR family regulator
MIAEELLSGITLLYVEDEDVARMAIGGFLKRKVGTIHLAQNGMEGLELFLKHHPTVVVTDLEMPIMSGLEMIRKIRELNNGTPIIITTAYDDEEHQCASADCTIIKPVIFSELLSTIVACLESKGAVEKK